MLSDSLIIIINKDMRTILFAGLFAASVLAQTTDDSTAIVEPLDIVVEVPVEVVEEKKRKRRGPPKCRKPE